MPHFPLFHNILSYFCTLFQHIFGNFCTLFYLILKQGRQSGQAKWAGKVAGKWAGKCLSCFCFSPCYNAILNTAFFTLPTSPDRTQGLCASPGRSMTSSPACRSSKDAFPAFQNRISALGSYSVSGVRSGCSCYPDLLPSLQNTLNIRISFMCLKTTVSIGLCLILLDADVYLLPIDHIFSAGQSRQFPGVYIFAYLLYALCRYSDLGILRQSVHISFDHCVSFRWYYLYMGPYAAQAR